MAADGAKVEGVAAGEAKAAAPAKPAGLDNSTKQTLQKIPLLSINAGPRGGEQFKARLKQEYTALIQAIGRVL